MYRNIDLLLSINDSEKFKNMSTKEKEQYIFRIKKQSTYVLFNASRALEAKDFQTAKKILIYITDACILIENPDREIQKILSICCQYLATIKKKQNLRKKTTIFGLNSLIANGSYLRKKTNLLVLKYNKFSGEFEFDQGQKFNNKQVLFYVSKLNSILIGYKNIQNLHSFMASLKTYRLAFLIFLLVIGIFCLYIFTNVLSSFDSVSQSNVNHLLPMIVFGASLMFPLLMIYIKKPFQRDTNFFKKKLGLEIKVINQQCRSNNKKIQFLLPEGAELNIKIEEEQVIQPMSKISQIQSVDILK